MREMGFIAVSRGVVPRMWISALWILAVIVDSSYLTTDAGFRKTGCYQFTAGTYTINMALDNSCNGARCPHCFILDTTYGPVDLTVNNCEDDIHSVKLGVSNLVTDYSFSNTARSLAQVKDGTGLTSNTYIVTPLGSRGSRAQCTCQGTGLLTCDSSVSDVYTLVAYNQYELNYNCVVVEGTVSLNQATTSCNNKYCPPCFQLDTVSAAVTLTLASCSYFVGKDYGTTAIVTYTFMNSGNNEGYVSDGTKTFTLPRIEIGSGSHTACSCYNNLLSCSSLTTKLNTALAVDPAIAYFPASLSVNNYLFLGHNGNTYAYYDSISSESVEFYTKSARTLTIGRGVGTLHGTWQADGAVGTSDSRMKKNIRNLQETLRELQQHRLSKDEAAKHGPTVGPAEWVLSQLRPVSFSFIADKKEGRRFGFIAEEVEQIFPELIRIDEADEKRVRRVLMMDFIALLWMALQDHQQLLEQSDRKSEAHKQTTEDRISRLENDLSRVETDVKRLSVEVADCRETAV